MNNNKGNILTIVGIIVLIAGVLFGSIFLIVSAVTSSSLNTKKEELSEIQDEYEKTDGIVTESYNGHTYVAYEDDYGCEYELKFNMSSSSYSTGKEVTVYYDEDNPYAAVVPELEISSLTIIKTVFGIIGGVIIALALIPGVVLIIVGAKIKKNVMNNMYNGYNGMY